jgi:hypothetical protein
MIAAVLGSEYNFSLKICFKYGNFPAMSLLCIWKLIKVLDILTEAITQTLSTFVDSSVTHLLLNLSFIFSFEENEYADSLFL